MKKPFGRTGELVESLWRERDDGLIDDGIVEAEINDANLIGAGSINADSIEARSIDAGSIAAGNWLVMRIERDELDRRGHLLIDQRVATVGRPIDLVIARGIRANDVKAGWPMHALQRLRERKICRYIGFELESSLEVEWIAANAPVHAIVLPYSRHDMSARYRAFDAAQNAGVALVGRAETADDVRLQRATPQLNAVIIPRSPPLHAIEPSNEVESLRGTKSRREIESRKAVESHNADESPSGIEPLREIEPRNAIESHNQSESLDEISPLDAVEVERLWLDYSSAHPAAPKPPSGHPPDEL